MNYTQREARVDDAIKIAPLWQKFLHQRSLQDPSFSLVPDFDYKTYVTNKLLQPSNYGFLLEYGEEKTIVGFLFIYIYDEHSHLLDGWKNQTPFNPRRIASVIGLYVAENHRDSVGIQLLANSAIALVEKLKVTDLDVLVGIEQTGIHALLQRFGFKKAAIQFTKHYDVTGEKPPLKSPRSQNIPIKFPEAKAIVFKNPHTQQNILNPEGNPVLLYPIKNSSGEILKNSSGMPIYPNPLIDPQTQEYLFDEKGELVVCPVMLDDKEKVIENQGLAIFQKPLYEMVEGKLVLKRDPQGKYLFSAEVSTVKSNGFAGNRKHSRKLGQKSAKKD